MDTLNGAVTDLSAFMPDDTSELYTVVPGTNKRTGWVITLAGPGHAKTVAANNEASRKQLHREQMQENSRVNGRKYKAEDRQPEEQRREFIDGLVARIVTWTPVRIGAETFEFSDKTAADLLLRPAMGPYVAQVVDALIADGAFMKGSASD